MGKGKRSHFNLGLSLGEEVNAFTKVQGFKMYVSGGAWSGIIGLTLG